MSSRLKKMMLMGLVFLAVGSPVFATTTFSIDTNTQLSLGFVQNAVNLIVGIFAGGYCLLKAALDIFHAVRNSSEDQNALKKAIGSFVLNAAILGGFMFVVNYVFGSMAKIDGKDFKNLSAQEVFFGALSGAIAAIPPVV